MTMVPRARDVLTTTNDSSPLFRQREDVLFRHLQMANGTYKTTGHSRLADLDRWLLSHLTPADTLAMLDIGVSSGATTVDLIEAAAAAGLRLQTTGIDIGMEASSLPLLGGGELLLDSQRAPLQFAMGRSTWGRPTRGVTSARASLGRVLFGALANSTMRSLLSSGAPVPVRLLCLRARECPDAVFIEHDVFRRNDAWRAGFDLVRAANVLHRAYFTDEQLRTAFAHAWHYLRDGGRLLIARTADEDGVTRATLFQKERDRRFGVIDRFQGGSDVEEVVLSVRVSEG